MIKKKVYISSTYGDLINYREAAYRALRRLGHDAIAMEDYVATDQRPLAKCLEDVARVDAYIGIFAWRYGYIPDEENPEGKSITELEYCQAQKHQKPCFIFLLNEDTPWMPKFTDSHTGAGEGGERINQLRQELGKTKLVSFFKSPDGLASLVSAAVANWVLSSNKETQGSKEKLEEPIRDNGKLVCPYQGLLAFTKKERPFFFGRQAVVEVIVKKLIQGKNFLPLIGASGSGKSSVVLAGLVPWLEEQGWEILDPPIKPGTTPLARLEKVLWKYFSEEEQEQLLKECIYDESSEGLKPLLECFPGGQHLLVVDQFEELFTVAQVEQHDRFIQLITQVADLPDSPLAIVTTMRADFLEPCLSYDSLRKLIEEDAKYLPTLAGKNLIDAICEPAKRQGYEVTDELLNQILTDIKQEPGFLPLLEFALTQLWSKRDQVSHKLTLESYKGIGGMVGALNRHADKVYQYRDYEKDSPQDERPEAEKGLIKRIFLKLLQIGERERDTRVRQPKAVILFLAGDNLEEQELLKELIDSKQGLVKGRLLVTGESEQEGEAWVDLAHEALIEGWKKLNEWRQEDREGRKLVTQMEKDAENYWKEHHKSPDKSPDFLWRGYKLEDAEKVLKKYDAIKWLSNQGFEFLEECRKQELRSFLLDQNVYSLDQMGLEEEVVDKPFLTKSRLRSLLEDEREDPKVRQVAYWVLKQWGVEPPPAVVEDLGKGISLELVEIPRGQFMMGSPEGEGEDNEKPQHEVTVQAFFMGKYPITQAQYQQIMGNNPSRFKGDERPVEKVSWHDAVKFCEKLSKQTGKEYRLPTEAEWEYACRAGTTTAYYFGEKITDNLVNYYGTVDETTAVGKYLPNKFGLYEMHGNIQEWCLDHWHNSYQNAPSDGSPWVSEGDSSYRVLRGGSWHYNPNLCRSAARSINVPELAYDYYNGFRVVCMVPRT